MRTQAVGTLASHLEICRVVTRNWARLVDALIADSLACLGSARRNSSSQ